MSDHAYVTEGGVLVRRTTSAVDRDEALAALAEQLNTQRGVLLSSGVECPGRYARFDLGFADPPLALTGRGRDFEIAALNPRGAVLLAPIAAALAGDPHVIELETAPDRLRGQVARAPTRFAEEQRSRQPSLFSVLRTLLRLFGSAEDRHLGLYGAFGYDLVFQFEPIPQRLTRADDQRDLVLYLPDRLLVVDRAKDTAFRHEYEFETASGSTAGLARATVPAPAAALTAKSVAGNWDGELGPGGYQALVERARAAFARGDLFEVVLGQVFTEPAAELPSTLFHRLSRSNPAPYGALINLGEAEFLISASPEMYVRVEHGRVETCPISGTIARGADALEDAEQIRNLLNSAKDEAELTMCTDVDRNDKSRICDPASIRVIGRRQIELYSRLIHTVDHVEGRLRPEFDALDAFLSHAWAVTVTGAPKPGAIRFIEEEEASPRRWYGGAIGRLGFDGGLDSGLTLRTIRLQHGLAEIRAGATLLLDSDPEAEDAECRLKAAALRAVLRGEESVRAPSTMPAATPAAAATRQVLLIDHEDSFVHTLAGYFRLAGAEIETLRPALARTALAEGRLVDLVVLSPGPGRPADFAMAATLDLLLERRLPIFGICLGLQGIVERFGGRLGCLDRPMHGKKSEIELAGAPPGGRLLLGLPPSFTAGRYHSLHADGITLPPCLRATAIADQVPMAIEHVSLPIAAVQFHPESIMTPAGPIGRKIVDAALNRLTGCW
jgi:anthranilate synthase